MLTTIAVIFYCGNLISQVQGDSHIESTYAKITLEQSVK